MSPGRPGAPLLSIGRRGRWRRRHWAAAASWNEHREPTGARLLPRSRTVSEPGQVTRRVANRGIVDTERQACRRRPALCTGDHALGEPQTGASREPQPKIRI